MCVCVEEHVENSYLNRLLCSSPSCTNCCTSFLSISHTGDIVNV